MPPIGKVVAVVRAAVLASVIVASILALWALAFSEPPRVTVSGEADVGGPFALTDHNGRPITDRDFRGRIMLITFGFASDPDLTPASLQVMTAALDSLGQRAEIIAPIFISLDPDRDTPDRLAAFVARYSPRLIGLTGTADALHALTSAYKLYNKRINEPQLPGGYSIDHQSLYYIMGKDGRFVEHVPHTTDVNALAGELRRAIGR